MRFRDLRETKKEIPVYQTVVTVRADIALDRAFCLNETETESFLRNRIDEISPNLKVRDIHVTNKGRSNGASLWETELALQGKVSVNAPIPKPEIQSMVRTLVQKAGFENADVKVRGTQKVGTAEEAPEPDERDFVELSKKAVEARFQKRRAPVQESDMRGVKPGAHVIVTRAGFTEEGEVVDILPDDQLVEVNIPSACSPVWLPFNKVLEVLPFHYEPVGGRKGQDHTGLMKFEASFPVQDQILEGELENNVFRSAIEFRSSVLPEDEAARLADKQWEKVEDFEKDFPGVTEFLVAQIAEKTNGLGEKEIGKDSRQVGTGNSARIENAPVTASFDEAEYDFAEAHEQNKRIYITLQTNTPAEIGEFTSQ